MLPQVSSNPEGREEGASVTLNRKGRCFSNRFMVGEGDSLTTNGGGGCFRDIMVGEGASVVLNGTGGCFSDL